MNAAILCGLVFGVGVAGLVRGIRPSRPLVKLSGMDAVGVGPGPATHLGRLSNLVGLSAATWAAEVGLMRGRFWDRTTTAMAVTDVSVDQLALQTVQGVGTAVLLPVLVWGLLQAGGIALPLLFPLGVILVLVPVGGCLPVVVLQREAAERRRHARTV
ncbi:MAG TPA: hypothetical protein VGI44_05675, partial [Acidimicrobiales bacterium]